MNKKRISLTAALLAIALTLFSVPAHATTWPTDGKFILGTEAMWQFDDFGVANGSDAAEYFLTPVNGYIPAIYYPMEYMAMLNGQNEFLKCDNQASSLLTYETNGDVTIECPRYLVDPQGIYVQLVYRIYGAANNGWLLRMETILTNDSDTDYEVTDLFTYQYAENYTYDSGASSTFMTPTSNSATSLEPNDTWFISAVNGGLSVVQTIAWARDGEAANYGIESLGDAAYDASLENLYANRTLPANESLHYIQFTNMNIPVPNSNSSTAEIAAARAQVEEFASFSGRLVAGLDESVDYIGWGLPQQTSPALETAAQPSLASTGANGDNILIQIGTAMLLFGGGLVTFSRVRRSSRN